jgi:hypothetical protein
MLHGLRHRLRIDAGGFSYLRGPDPSDFGTSRSAEALYNAIFFGAPGVYVALGHCAEEALQAELRAEAGESWRPSTDLSHGSKSCTEQANWSPQRAWLAKVNNRQSCHGSTQRPSD